MTGTDVWGYSEECAGGSSLGRTLRRAARLLSGLRLADVLRLPSRSHFPSLSRSWEGPARVLEGARRAHCYADARIEKPEKTSRERPPPLLRAPARKPMGTPRVQVLPDTLDAVRVGAVEW